ncbi:MAG: hypothetical protein LBT45_02760 [Rickettsiales bacterium]|jgi:hypothetical protein|nr:hypothetical protein [Rickettsiales bacterium]
MWLFFKKTKIQRFSDFAAAESGPFPGEKISIEEILDKDVVVTDFAIRPSKIKKNEGEECLYLQLKVNGRNRMMITGSKVLMKQIKAYQSHIPFSTRITRRNKKYLSFS